MNISLTDLMEVIPEGYSLHIYIAPRGDVKMKLTYGTYEATIVIPTEVIKGTDPEILKTFFMAQFIKLSERIQKLSERIQENRGAIQKSHDDLDYE